MKTVFIKVIFLFKNKNPEIYRLYVLGFLLCSYFFDTLSLKSVKIFM